MVIEMGLWPKFKNPKVESSSNNFRSRLNVNEEYLEAFRTKSFTEIWSKVQGQLQTTDQDQERTPSISPLHTYSHLSENILEPRQDVLLHMIETSDLHHLLIDYFEASSKAFKICGSLLQTIDQVRANRRVLQKIMIRCDRVPNSSYECRLHILRELSSFVKLDNPLSVSNKVKIKFCRTQNCCRVMLDKLRTKHRKVKRKAEVIKVCKKASAISLVIACGTVSVVTLVLAIHSLIGIVAAPALVSVPFAFIKKNIKSAQREFGTNSLMKLCAQLDAAAKGVFFLNRDFDTLSQLMMWLHDEIEYAKSRAELCLKDQTGQMLMDSAKEFQRREVRFLEKLEELEEHVYLCFLNINRFRRLVVQEAMVQTHQQS